MGSNTHCSLTKALASSKMLSHCEPLQPVYARQVWCSPSLRIIRHSENTQHLPNTCPWPPKPPCKPPSSSARSSLPHQSLCSSTMTKKLKHTALERKKKIPSETNKKACPTLLGKDRRAHSMQASSASWQRVGCQQGGAAGAHRCCPRLGSHGRRAQHGGRVRETVIAEYVNRYLH